MNAAGRPSPARPRRPSSSGMTLLELMVALSIFALIGSALMPVVQGTLSSRRDAVERAELASEARMIVDRLESDLAASCNAGFQSPLPVRFVAEAPRDLRFDAARNLVEVTTLVARGVTSADAFVGGEDVQALSADRGDLAQVLWRIDEEGRLLRQELRPPRTETVEWPEEPLEVVSEHATVALEFYQAQTWSDDWDSSETGPRHGQAPEAVRSTVRVDDGRGAPLELVSTVVLPTVVSASALRQRTGAGP